MSNARQFPFKRPSGPPPGLVARAEELRTAIRLVPADLLAARTGSTYAEGEFHLFLFGAPVTGSCPALTFSSAAGNLLPDFQQALLLYYFATSNGSPLTGKFVSLADLPDGRMYAQAFQGYTGNEVVKAFGADLESFKAACQKAGGIPLQIGDAAYGFQALPQVPVQVVYWLGDEDFPSSCKILFDSSATHYLPIDGCAIIGSTLVRRLLPR
jgi:hypothetical protein